MRTKPNYHVLEIRGRVLATVAIWKEKDRNVVMPRFFNIKGGNLKRSGDWLTPIMQELVEDEKPLYLLDHYGYEFEVDKQASVATFFL